VGDDSFEQKTYDVLGSAGFQTIMGQSAKLFSDQKKGKRSPRFILGAKIIDLGVEITWDDKLRWASRHVARIRLVIEWQVLDNAQRKVVYTTRTNTTSVEHSYNSYTNAVLLSAYEIALGEFLMDGKFAELVNKTKASDPLPNMEIVGVETSTKIPQVPKLVFESSSEMIQAATLACVTIETDAGHGSGVLMSSTGLILTANHVIEGVNRIDVILSTGLKLEATLVSSDESHDVALLKIPGSGYKALPVGDSQQATLGTDVFTIGTPTDIELGQSVSKGIVSGKRKVEEIVYIQTDVSVSPGNSGGPLINPKGEVIGIIQKKLIGNGIEGVGFALPIETVLKQLGIAVE
jgi:S1-C subfamily serine protease